MRLALLCGLVWMLVHASMASRSDAAEMETPFSEIVYSNAGRIAVSNGDGGERRLLTNRGKFPADARDAAPEFSPNGSRIVFVRSATPDVPGGKDLMLMDRDGGDLHSILRYGGDPDLGEPSVRDPSWSPDGNSIYFIEYADGRQSVKRLRLDGSGTSTVFENRYEPLGITDVDPSPDGERLIVGLEGWRRSNGKQFSRTYSVDIGTGQASLLAREASFGDWSPDGSRIVFDRRREPADALCWQGRCSSISELFVMNSDGSGARRLIRGKRSWRATAARWSPDGSRISFTSGRNGASEIYTVKPDGSCAAFLTNGSPESYQGSWNPAGTGPAGRAGCGEADARPLIEYPARNLGGIFGQPHMWLGERYLGNATSGGQDPDPEWEVIPGLDDYIFYQECLSFEPANCEYGVNVITEPVCRALPRVFPLWNQVVYKGMVSRRGALVLFTGWKGEKGVAEAQVLSGGRSIVLGSDGPSSWHNEFPRRRFLRMVDRLRPVWQTSGADGRLPRAELAPKMLNMFRKVLRLRRHNSFEATARKAGMSRQTLRYQLATAEDIRRLGPVGAAKGCVPKRGSVG
ncbi:MAG TPA: hypothetical protein VMF31_08070 [Solirubrobacterales bacterium]|nr:hypothetical protein [Solirubrobacterales bacterium]